MAPAAVTSDPDVPVWLADILKHAHVVHAVDSTGGLGTIALLAYIVLLVGFAGQTFGMMIMDLRVVSDRFGRIGIGRALLRYVCLFGSIAALIGMWKIFSRVQPFEKWSGTRLIEGAAYARNRERLMAQSLEAVS